MIPLSLGVASILLVLSLWKEIRPVSRYVVAPPVYVAQPPPQPVYVAQPPRQPVYIAQPPRRHVHHNAPPKRKTSTAFIIIGLIIVLIILGILLYVLSRPDFSSYNEPNYVETVPVYPQPVYPQPVYQTHYAHP